MGEFEAETKDRIGEPVEWKKEFPWRMRK